MKYLALFIFICIASSAFAQKDGPKEITPQMLEKIKADVEKDVPAFKKSLSDKNYSANEIEFAVDTFRIEDIADKRIDIDYSTVGMNTTVNEMTAAYDKLMNKYYGKLMLLMKPADKTVLITAQRAWIAYRDAEAKLIVTMADFTYSGGTIRSNIFTSAYAQLIIDRTKDIFNYYNNAVSEK